MSSTSPSDPPPSYSSHHHSRHHHHKHSSKDVPKLSRDDKNDATNGVKDKDNHSTSPSSKHHSSPNEKHHHSRDKMLTHDEILSLARQGMPRSKFGPEFLKRLEKQGLQASTSKGMPKFRVISGAEAAKLYNEAIRREDHKSHHRSDSKHEHVPYHNHNHNPVVFAFPGREAGSKVVDYYMTWRGKTPTHRLKGRRRRGDMLEEEFKKVVEGLENKYQEEKRHSVLEPSSQDPVQGEAGPSSSGGIPMVERVEEREKKEKKEKKSEKEKKRDKERERPEPVTTHSAPAVLQEQSGVEIPEVLRVDTMVEDESEGEGEDILSPLLPPTRPLLASRESSSSVTSLPYLGMVRGVPVGNRLPLKVVNPDPSSDSRRSSIASATFAKKFENLLPVSSPLKKPPGLTVVEEVVDHPDDDVHSEEEDGKSVLTSLFSRKSSKVKPSRPSKRPDDSSSTSSPSYDSRSLSGSSSSSNGSHGDNKEILIVLMDEQDPNLKDVKPPEIRVDDIKLSRKSSTKPPSRKVSTRGSPWDGPAATAPPTLMGLGEARGSSKSLVHIKRNSSHSSHYKHSPTRSPYSHPHSSHSSYSSLLDDEDFEESSSWDTEETDDEDDMDKEKDPIFHVGLKTALETLRFHSSRYAKTPSPRRTPSGGGAGLPPVTPINFNPGTTVVTPAPSPYVAPGLARLGSQHASPYVNHNVAQMPNPAVHMSPAGSYGLAALYASPYPTQSVTQLPPQSQAQTPMVQAVPLVPGQGQSPYVQPFVAMPIDHISNHGTPLNPPGLTLHPHSHSHSHPHPHPHAAPHHTPAAVPNHLGSTYTSPYVTPAQLPVPVPGSLPPLGGMAMGQNGTTPYVSPYATPASRPPVPLYGPPGPGASVHGTPYTNGVGPQLYPIANSHGVHSPWSRASGL